MKSPHSWLIVLFKSSTDEYSGCNAIDNSSRLSGRFEQVAHMKIVFAICWSARLRPFARVASIRWYRGSRSVGTSLIAFSTAASVCHRKISSSTKLAHKKLPSAFSRIRVFIRSLKIGSPRIVFISSCTYLRRSES